MENEVQKYKTIILIMFALVIILIVQNILLMKSEKEVVDALNKIDTINTMQVDLTKSGDVEKNDNIDLGWELVLVNSDNKIPEDYEFELEYIDANRQFDNRAIVYLKEMLIAAKSDGITNLWAQSTYRSIETQEGVFNDKVKQYMRQGMSEEESRKLTERSINKPGYSEHNLGISVDFNYVNNDFENTKAFKWLNENAENYGFILRYKEEKEDITKVKYEPWHWRYVGKENAIKMNELDMCLEEYVEYLKNQECL